MIGGFYSHQQAIFDYQRVCPSGKPFKGLMRTEPGHAGGSTLPLWAAAGRERWRRCRGWGKLLVSWCFLLFSWFPHGFTKVSIPNPGDCSQPSKFYTSKRLFWDLIRDEIGGQSLAITVTGMSPAAALAIPLCCIFLCATHSELLVCIMLDLVPSISSSFHVLFLSCVLSLGFPARPSHISCFYFSNPYFSLAIPILLPSRF